MSGCQSLFFLILLEHPLYSLKKCPRLFILPRMRVFLFISLLSCISCETQDRSVASELAAMLAGASTQDFDWAQGLATWQNAKSQNGSTYNYQRSYSSMTGFQFRTLIQIKDDAPHARAYVSQSQADSWVETSGNVGSHATGHPPLTMEEIYGKCKSEILSKSKVENTVVFQADERGVPTCYYCSFPCSRRKRCRH